MAKKPYQGWSNHETWCMYHCLTVDEETFRAALQHAQKGIHSLKRFAEECVRQERDIDIEMPASCKIPHLQAALALVNWREIMGELIESLR